MVLAMGEAIIFVVDSDEAVGQCDDEDMRKLEALAANKSDFAQDQLKNNELKQDKNRCTDQDHLVQDAHESFDEGRHDKKLFFSSKIVI